MSVTSDIRDGLIALFKQVHGDNEVFSAEVTAVDMDTRSCTVISISDKTETEYTGVWLMPQVDDGILYQPKIGSTVIVQHNRQLQPYVVMWSELDGIYYVINQTAFALTDGNIQFNDGSNAGLVNIKPLVQKINNLENLLNDLITKYNSHTHTGVQTGGGTSGPTAALETNNISPLTQQSDLEDTLVTH
jgi:GpV Apex motif